MKFRKGDKVRVRGVYTRNSVGTVKYERKGIYGVVYPDGARTELAGKLLELVKRRGEKSRRQQIHELRNQQRADDRDRKIRFEHAINK